MLWRRPHYYMLAELVDSPVLGMMMSGAGMERRALELLLEFPQRREADGDRAAAGASAQLGQAVVSAQTRSSWITSGR